VTGTELGDPQAAAAIAGHLSQMAGGLDAAAKGLGPDGVTWSGAAATAFAALLAVQPQEFARVAEACRTVSGALRLHSDALTDAQGMLRRAEAYQGTDPLIARTLTDEARAAASASAARAARHVRDVAASAPDKPSLAMRALRKGSEWLAEFRFGAVEATESLTGLALSVNQFRLVHAPGDTVHDAGKTLSGVTESARDPMAMVRAIVDWDTWRSNPSRAAGHLVPDVVAAATTAGTATSARSATIGARQHAAIDNARRLDDARRSAMAEAGDAARKQLVQDAVLRGNVKFLPPREWRGPGLMRLSRPDTGAADTYWFMIANHEQRITQLMAEIGEEVRGILFGFENRLKGPESFKRKIASMQARKGVPIDDLLARINDVVRYTLVFGETRYSAGVVETSALLEQRGFHRVAVDNHWHRTTRYRGINTSWVHLQSGALIEVQFHTPASNLATTLSHGMYERMRLPQTTRPERRQLQEKIAAIYANAPQPPGSEWLSKQTIPPPSPPKEIVMPPDISAALGSTAAAATAGIQTADRLSRGTAEAR
jgi:hypothetical protein